MEGFKENVVVIFVNVSNACTLMRACIGTRNLAARKAHAWCADKVCMVDGRDVKGNW